MSLTKAPDLFGPFHIEKGTRHSFYIYRKKDSRQGPWYIEKADHINLDQAPEMSNELASYEVALSEATRLAKEDTLTALLTGTPPSL